ncbi:MAG TPA: hypothetical protein VJR02_23615 [Pyrinomonadaceae bacterium]|nr:hypothetical protein [Pyrinomonadaceae bacterium]
MLRNTRRIIYPGSAHTPSPLALFVALALTNCLLLTACSTVPQKSRALAQVLEKSSEEKRATQSLSMGNSRAKVYLDASLSMAGYVTGQPDNQTKFDNFIDRLGDYLPGCRIFKFGQGESQELLSPANFDRSIHAPGFYSLTYNPNDALIRQINSDEEVAFSVIVTDGVQSDDPGQGNPPVVEAIVEWLKKGGAFGIFVLRSGFKGPFYSEHVRDWIRNENGSSQFDIASRPFYAFVLSPTQHEFDELRVKILRDFPDTSVIVTGQNSVTCDIKDATNGPKPYGKGAPQWRWFKDPFGRNPTAKWDHSVQCKLDPEYPAGRLSLTAQATTYPWNGNDFGSSEAPAAIGSKFLYEELEDEASLAAQSFLLKLTLVPDARSKITFYRIRSDASLSDLRNEIRSLNTEDDSDPRDVEKTYRLSSLLIALTEAHLKAFVREQSLPRLYLTVENK